MRTSKTESFQCSLEVCIVVKDAVIDIQQTVQSILKNIYDEERNDFSIRILDGFSTDGTWEYINKIVHQNRNVNFNISQSEPRGVYDAMNVCVNKSKAVWVWFVNAGDLVVNPINIVIDRIKSSDNNIGAIIGGCGLFFKSNPSLFFLNNSNWPDRPHQSTIYRKSLHFRYGVYDVQFKALSDKIFLNSILESEVINVDTPLAATLVSPRNMSRRPSVVLFDVRKLNLKKPNQLNIGRFRIIIYKIESILGFSIFTFCKIIAGYALGNIRILRIKFS